MPLRPRRRLCNSHAIAENYSVHVFLSLFPPPPLPPFVCYGFLYLTDLFAGSPVASSFLYRRSRSLAFADSQVLSLRNTPESRDSCSRISLRSRFSLREFFSSPLLLIATAFYRERCIVSMYSKQKFVSVVRRGIVPCDINVERNNRWHATAVTTGTQPRSFSSTILSVSIITGRMRPNF